VGNAILSSEADDSQHEKKKGMYFSKLVLVFDVRSFISKINANIVLQAQGNVEVRKSGAGHLQEELRRVHVHRKSCKVVVSNHKLFL